MNFRCGAFLKTFLLLCLPLSLLVVPVLVSRLDVGSYFRGPEVVLVGRWRMKSKPESMVVERFYEFRADGTYVERNRTLVMTGPMEGTNVSTGTALVNQSLSGTYKLSADHRLTLVERSPYSSPDTFKIWGQGQGVVTEGDERWYRVQ